MKRLAVALLSLALLAAPLGAEAQAARKIARLGYLWLGTRGSDTSPLEGLRQGLRELGYAEGQSFVIESRYADGHADRLPDLIRELVNLDVDVILTPGTVVTQAAQQVTTTVPIISMSGDPVGSGFAASLARPGGNITGLSINAGCGIGGKRLELLKESFPHVRIVAHIWNPTNTASARCVVEVAPTYTALGLKRRPFELRQPGDLAAALSTAAQERVDALTADDDPLIDALRGQIVHFAAEHRLPAVYGQRGFVEVGGLMSYAASIFDLWRRVATYVDKILKGAKPGDLPVERPTKFELVINLKTAKTLGLTIPQSVLLRADEVIQ